MKTTKEMIEVMQAYLRGEKIEGKMFDEEDFCWTGIEEPQWDWYHVDYRVKPKKKFVPFDTAEEFLAAQRVHGNSVFFGGNKYTAYINLNGIIRLIPCDNSLNYMVSELEYMLDWIFDDGTPCGKEVAE